MTVKVDGVLFNESMTVLLEYPKEREGNYVIPSGTVTIKSQAFYKCLGLTSVEIPSSVKTIEGWAFYECLGLTSVEIPSSVKRIGGEAFYNCKKLQSLTMHDGLEIIESDAFSYCALQAVVVPKTVKIVGYSAFSGCPDITIFDSIDPTADMCCDHIDTMNGYPTSEVGYIGMGSAWAMPLCAANHRRYDYVITVLSAQTGQLKYRVWMDIACSQRSYYCLLTSAWGRNASFCFSALDSFFPEIEGLGMKLRLALRRMKYPYELTPENEKMYLSYLSRYAKTMIRGLIDGNDMETLLFCETLGIIRKDHISEMIEFAISRKNTAFTEYLQKYQLEKFGVSAVKLKTNTPKDSKRETSQARKDPLSRSEMRKNWAFENNVDGSITITSYRGHETEVEVPGQIGGATVTHIAAEAFSPEMFGRRGNRKYVLGSITKITLPDSIREIGDKAFFGCVSLREINRVNPPVILGKVVLSGCTVLYDKSGFLVLDGYLHHAKATASKAELRIPEGVHTILPYAFWDSRFDAPVRLTFPTTLRKIDDYAFNNFSNLYVNLRQIVLPEGLEEIGKYAFSRCVVRDSRLVIPGSVRTVEDWAFQDCVLDEVWVNEGVQTIGKNCFTGNRVTLHLPASLKSIGLIYSSTKQSVFSMQVIRAPRGGAAEAYAGKYGFKFVEEAAVQPPNIRDTDYAADCAQRFDQLLSRLSAPPSLSINHGGLLQGITFLAAESLEVIRQFYEEYGQPIPRFVIDDTAEFLSEAELRKLLQGAPRNNDGQLSLGKMQFIVDAHYYGSLEAYKPQIQLIAKNVSRDRVKVFWRIYQPESYYKNKSHRFHVLGQEMGNEE